MSENKTEEIIRVPDERLVRPSKMPQISACPYSWFNCLNWEEEKSSDSERGTAMHYAMANGIEKALSDGYNISKEDIETVKRLRAIFVEGQTEEGEQLLQELPVSVVFGNREVTRGTLDYLLLNDDKTEGVLIDWKFGSMRVNDSPTNLQLQAYVEGAFQGVKTLKALKVLIIQPACMSWEEIEDPSAWKVTREESENNFLANIVGIEMAAHAATDKDAIPSADNCRFCNKMNCPAWRRMCEDAITVVLGKEGAELTTKYAFKDANVEEALTYADKALDKIATIEDFIKEKKKVVTNYIIEKGGSANYKIVKAKRTTVKWKELAQKLGATADDVAEYTETSEGAPYLRRTTKRSSEQWN